MLKFAINVRNIFEKTLNLNKIKQIKLLIITNRTFELASRPHNRLTTVDLEGISDAKERKNKIQNETQNNCENSEKQINYV